MAADRILATCALVQVLSVGVLIGQFYWRHTTKQRTHPRHGHRYIACSTVQDPMISCRTPPSSFASAGPSPCVTHDLCADADLLARFKLTRIFDCFWWTSFNESESGRSAHLTLLSVQISFISDDLLIFKTNFSVELLAVIHSKLKLMKANKRPKTSRHQWYDWWKKKWMLDPPTACCDVIGGGWRGWGGCGGRLLVNRAAGGVARH